MPDPIAHDDLTNLDTRREAYRLSVLLGRVVDGADTTAAKIALVGILSALAETDGEDFDEVADQIRDAFETDACTVTSEEVDDIDDNLNAN